MALRTYQGSCHCGRVRFEVDADLETGTGRCNCTYCGMVRWWGTTVKPAAFRLLAGEGDLSDYQFGSMAGHHRFCKHCGIHPFGDGHVPEIGGDYVSINIACLDLDQSALAELPINYANGRDNAWWQPPAHTRHL